MKGRFFLSAALFIILNPFTISAQTNDELADITAEAITTWFMLQDAGFFQSNYERYFDKQIEKLNVPYHGIILKGGLGGKVHDSTADLNIPDNDYDLKIGYRANNIGFNFFKIDLQAMGWGILNGRFLQPLGEWVDEKYYIPNYLRYDINGSVTFFNFLKIGFAKNGYTEFYKRYMDFPYTGAALDQYDYEKYTFNIKNIDRFFKRAGVFNKLSSFTRNFLEDFGIDNKFIVEDFINLKLINNTLYTGLPIIPLVSTIWIKDIPDLLLDISFMLPIGRTYLSLDAGLSLGTGYLYKASLRWEFFPFLSSVTEDGQDIAEANRSFLSGTMENIGGFISFGPEIYFSDYPFFQDRIFPYNDDVFVPQGSGIRIYGAVFGKWHRVALKMVMSVSLGLGNFLELIDEKEQYPQYYFDDQLYAGVEVQLYFLGKDKEKE